ncbi:MAG: hypothetical protein NTV70_03090, partial [Acidobacteria bacterium]|nr:hypothetical protein [Acidobacteriota bacterium]
AGQRTSPPEPPRMKWLWLAALTAVVIATRVPYFQQQLFSYDDVNLAYAVGELDVRQSQPHPPGYPLFVMEMRVLKMLRVKRAESMLQILAVAGSVAAVAVMIWGFPQWGGVWGAALLAIHPVFWYAGLTSAVRVQLALVSVAVAAACWRAWEQRPGWDVRSAWIFGLGAGIRPELGLVLLPLWWWTSRRAWKHWLAAVALWLVPLLWASGGPIAYVRYTWHYLQDQSRLTSGLFGADTLTWSRIGVWLLVWILCGVPGWALAWPLSWRPAASFPAIPWRFLALWTLPGVAFAFLVHVADPGQTLAVVAPVCLIGGMILDRARARLAPQSVPLSIACLTGVAIALLLRDYPMFVTAWAVPAVALLAGVLIWLQPNSRWLAGGLTLAPAVIVSVLIFGGRGWYTKGPLEHVASALAATSFEQVKQTTDIDDRTIREVRALLQPGGTIAWERGITSWRKLTYYFSGTPVLVLDRKTLDPRSASIKTLWLGPRQQTLVPLSPHAPIVWVRGPHSAQRCPQPEQFVCPGTGREIAW